MKKERKNETYMLSRKNTTYSVAFTRLTSTRLVSLVWLCLCLCLYYTYVVGTECSKHVMRFMDSHSSNNVRIYDIHTYVYTVCISSRRFGYVDFGENSNYIHTASKRVPHSTSSHFRVLSQIV